jgi:hypothetical protein
MAESLRTNESQRWGFFVKRKSMPLSLLIWLDEALMFLMSNW